MQIYHPIARPPHHATSPARVVQQLETEHFAYAVWQSRAGRLCNITARPVSAAARHYVEAQGYVSLCFTARRAALPYVVQDLEARLATYWGPVLDTRRTWPR